MSSTLYTDNLKLPLGDSKQFWPSKFRYVVLFVICILGFGVYGIKHADAATLTRAPTNLGLVGYWSFNSPR